MQQYDKNALFLKKQKTSLNSYKLNEVLVKLKRILFCF